MLGHPGVADHTDRYSEHHPLETAYECYGELRIPSSEPSQQHVVRHALRREVHVTSNWVSLCEAPFVTQTRTAELLDLAPLG